MANTKVGTRYAKAFLGLVAEKGKLDGAIKDMELVAKTIADNRELAVLLKSPVVKADKKVSILTSIFKKHVSEVTMLYLELITKNRREGALAEIADAFVAQYKAMKGITTAVVTSAAVLSSDAKKRIEELVQKQVGGTVELETQVNPELIGGFVLRIGDQQLDTSILNQISELKQEFGANFYEKQL